MLGPWPEAPGPAAPGFWLKELKETYNKPVYGLGVLPSTWDAAAEKESLYLSNALRSLEFWRKYLDNVLLVDNQQYQRRLDFGESINRLYQRINNNLTQRLITVLNAGEVRPAPRRCLILPKLSKPWDRMATFPPSATRVSGSS